jgi:hypothetical protein
MALSPVGHVCTDTLTLELELLASLELLETELAAMLELALLDPGLALLSELSLPPQATSSKEAISVVAAVALQIELRVI